MSTPAETKKKVMVVKDTKSKSLEELEHQRRRGSTEEKLPSLQTEDDSTSEESKKNRHIKIPKIVTIISYIHIVAVTVCLFLALYYYNEYVTNKIDDEEKDPVNGMNVVKIVACIATTGFLSYSRALILEGYY